MKHFPLPTEGSEPTTWKWNDCTVSGVWLPKVKTLFETKKFVFMEQSTDKTNAWKAVTRTMMERLGDPRKGLTVHMERRSKDDAGLWIPGEGGGDIRLRKNMKRLHCLVLDFDNGAHPDLGIAWAERTGYCVHIATSFNHGTTTSHASHASLVAALKKLPEMGEVSSEPDDADLVLAYKSLHKDLTPEIMDSLEVALVDRDNGEWRVYFNHAPLSKWRMTVFLQDSVSWTDDKSSEMAWHALVERKQKGLAKDIGAVADRACHDTSRMFRLPSRPVAAAYLNRLFLGALATLADIPELEGSDRVSQMRITLNEPIKAPSGGDLRDWFMIASDVFQAADWARDNLPTQDILRDSGGEKVTARCPFHFEHGNDKGDADTGFVAINADLNGKKGRLHCSHGTCAHRVTEHFLAAFLTDDPSLEESLFEDAYFPFSDDEDHDQDMWLTLGKAWATPPETPSPDTEWTEDKIVAHFKGLAARDADAVEIGTAIDEIAKAVKVLTKPQVRKIAKDAIKAHEAETTPEKEAGPKKAKRPTVPLHKWDFEQTVPAVLTVLKLATDDLGSPRFFDADGRVAELRKDRHGRKSIHVLSLREFTAIVNDLIRFEKRLESGDIKGVSVPEDIISDVFSFNPVGFYRPILRVVDVPVLARDGLVDKPGYDEASGLYYCPDPKLNLGPTLTAPTRDQFDDAVDELLDVAMDFRLGGASRAETLAASYEPDETGVRRPIPALANTFALLFGLFCRDFISDGIPLTMISKANIAAGSTTLVEVLTVIATGKRPAVRGMPKKDDEMRKTIATDCSRRERVIFWDNIDHAVHSPILAGAVTGDEFWDRTMGENTLTGGPFRQAIIMTGLRPRLSDELCRRTILLDIDTGMANATKRKDYAYPKIVEHVVANRAKYVRAVLVMIAYWLNTRDANGQRTQCPPEDELPNFLHYSQVTGGILALAGIHGFNRNRDILEKLVASIDGDPHTEAVTTWVEAHAAKPLTYPLDKIATKDLAAMWKALETSLPARLRRDRPENDFDYDPTQIAHWLGQKDGAVFEVGEDEYKLTQYPKGRNGRPWGLTKMVKPDTPSV